MNQYFFLLIILGFQFIRAVFLRISGKKINFLWVSTFILSIPFEIAKSIGDSALKDSPGAFGPFYLITVPLLLSCFAIFQSKFISVISFKINNWVTITTLLIIVSLFNPFNVNHGATLAFAIIFISNILFFKILSSFLSGLELLQGLFDGLLVLTVIQFALAICFPVLNIAQVTSLFHEGGEVNATREGNRVGAIGLFDHPGKLAIYSLISSSLFLTTFLYSYRKKTSLFIFSLNTLTLILTFSRTAYLVYVIVTVFLVFVKRNGNRNVFSILNLFRIFLPISLVLGWLVFLSPLSDTFLKSDSNIQVDNRTTHYKMAYHMFKDSPILGVGINAHLSYVAAHPIILSSVVDTHLKEKVDFFRENPIHNIHLIILAETGLIGSLLWVAFILSNIYFAATEIRNGRNQIMSLTLIGVLVSICLYGMTGWAPFSNGLLPFSLIICYFAISSR